MRIGELLQGSTRAKLSLAALSALFFLITAATFTSLGVVLPAMVTELKWSWADAGLGFTLLSVACGLASYAPTVAIRRFGVRPTLLAGAGVLAAGMTTKLLSGPLMRVRWMSPAKVKESCLLASQRSSSSTPWPRVPTTTLFWPSWVRSWR